MSCARSQNNITPEDESLSAEEIRALEEKAKDIGLTEGMLIENASSNLFSCINELRLGTKVLVAAGRGNNGADVLSCARKLFSRGYKVKAIVLEDKPLGEQSAIQKNILEKMNVPVYSIQQDNAGIVREYLKESDFVLDGILGIGVSGEVSPFIKEVISLINEGKKKIISCDIPSGLHPDSGMVLGAAIKADYTITFLAPKRGFFINQGREICGRIFVVDIGVSRQALQSRV